MLRTERQSAGMSKIKNGGLDQYGDEPFEQQQFGTAGVEGVKLRDNLRLSFLEYIKVDSPFSLLSSQPECTRTVKAII